MLLSPSKRLDFDSPVMALPVTQPAFLPRAKQLVELLKSLSPQDIAQLMGISDTLSNLNHSRYRAFRTPFTQHNARAALLAFKGDVYAAMDVEQYSEADFAFAQTHLRMLSGLYGLLKPLDLIQPYRLEMGTGLNNAAGHDLYAFWGSHITQAINKAVAQAGGSVINLASIEYFSAVKPQLLKAPLIHIVFKEKRGNELKTIGIMAKKARGAMANWVISERVTAPSALKFFNEHGYVYQPRLSTPQNWVFLR